MDSDEFEGAIEKEMKVLKQETAVETTVKGRGCISFLWIGFVWIVYSHPESQTNPKEPKTNTRAGLPFLWHLGFQWDLSFK